MATFTGFPKVHCCPGWVGLKSLVLGLSSCSRHTRQTTLLGWVVPKEFQLDLVLPIYLGVGLLHPWAESEQ